MLTILLRSILVYVLLITTMRIMGKRQLGELEVSELAGTLLVSEIASLPIVDKSIPLSYAVIPLVTVLFLEVTLSVLLLKFPRFKNLGSARPSVLIRHGVLDQKEMKKVRISLDELISEIRQSGFSTFADVDYAIVEQNGRISVLPRRASQAPSASELCVQVKECGIMHALIEDGVPNRHSLMLLGLDEDWLKKLLASKGLPMSEVFFLGRDDAGNLYWVKKEKDK